MLSILPYTTCLSKTKRKCFSLSIVYYCTIGATRIFFFWAGNFLFSGCGHLVATTHFILKPHTLPTPTPTPTPHRRHGSSSSNPRGTPGATRRRNDALYSGEHARERRSRAVDQDCGDARRVGATPPCGRARFFSCVHGRP